MSNESGLTDLMRRLDKLGVNFHMDISPSSATAGPALAPAPAKVHGGASKSQGKDVSQLLKKIDRVEAAISSAEALGHVGKKLLDEEAMKPRPSAHSPSAPSRPARQALKPGVPRARVSKPAVAKEVMMSAAMTAAAARPYGGSHGLASDQGHARNLPINTPLSSVLAQFKESETSWAHEKARLRREADEERRRASKTGLELQRASRMLEHKQLDTKALKSALRNRDNQLAVAGERIKELEAALMRTQEESSQRISALNAERDDLKALLLATLQRLEALDEMVHRADASSSMMHEKMKSLEDERLRALEAAARARAEVQELAESRRKLQWQSKLLEKMSEVQLKHNQHKSEAIRKLLSQPMSEAIRQHEADHDDLLDRGAPHTGQEDSGGDAIGSLFRPHGGYS